MSSIVWERKITKGNSKGTGWLSLPRELKSSLELGSYYDVTLFDEKIGRLEMLLKLVEYSSSLGFYIPKKICEDYKLLKKKLEVTIEDSEYFPGQVPTDRRVYLPYSIISRYGIKENELYEVEIVANGMVFGEVVIISKTDRSKAARQDEYAITIRLCKIPTKVRVKVRFIRKIEILTPITPPHEDEYFYIPSLFHDAVMGKIHENEMVIFLGNHVPLFTPIRINLLEFIHYFGCYYADGTKKGWAWSISASTPEQAVYYIEKYNQMIFGNQLSFRLTYSKKPSDKRTNERVKEDLIKYWKEKTDVEIEKKKILLRVTKHDNVRKWNKCGSLGIKDNRNLVMEIHLRIMKKIIRHLDKCSNDNHLWDFLFGILEGDGSVSGGKSRFGVGFSFHKDDKIIREFLDKLDIKYSVDSSRVKRGTGSCIQISFGLFEILTNIGILVDRLFEFYPKRRKTFVDRLLNQQTIKNLLKYDSQMFLRHTTIKKKYVLDVNEIREKILKVIKETSI